MSQPLALIESVDFSVITLNLYHDRDDWPRRRTQILSTLRALQPDVIALQEARIIFDQPIASGGWASDHFGLEVRLKLENTPKTR